MKQITYWKNAAKKQKCLAKVNKIFWIRLLYKCIHDGIIKKIKYVTKILKLGFKSSIYFLWYHKTVMPLNKMTWQSIKPWPKNTQDAHYEFIVSPDAKTLK